MAKAKQDRRKARRSMFVSTRASTAARERHRISVRALGSAQVNDARFHDSPSVRGLINQVSHPSASKRTPTSAPVAPSPVQGVSFMRLNILKPAAGARKQRASAASVAVSAPASARPQAVATRVSAARSGGQEGQGRFPRLMPLQQRRRRPGFRSKYGALRQRSAAVQAGYAGQGRRHRFPDAEDRRSRRDLRCPRQDRQEGEIKRALKIMASVIPPPVQRKE